MKKINKKRLVFAIILIIMLVLVIKFLNDSRADDLIEITANILDNSGLLSDEQYTILANNEGKNGYSIILPEIINNKKVIKYFVENKQIESNQENKEEIQILEKTAGEKIYLTRRRGKK